MASTSGKRDVIKCRWASPAKFRNVANFMERGEILIYHTGVLSIDYERNKTIRKVADYVKLLVKRGDGHCFQRRNGAVFDYIFMRA